MKTRKSEIFENNGTSNDLFDRKKKGNDLTYVTVMEITEE